MSFCEPCCIANARLPRWLLPQSWPAADGEVDLAFLTLADGRVEAVEPMGRPHAHLHALAHAHAHGSGWDVGGAILLPGFVDAHTHLDKAFTAARMGKVEPGLLGGIAATAADRRLWTHEDLRSRASRALDWAYDAGTVHLRTHLNWWQVDAAPLAWHALAELRDEWAQRIRIERVALAPLGFFQNRAEAGTIARRVAESGPDAVLGAFVHTSNWDPAALEHLLTSAEEAGLDVDLHVDEELNPDARGVATVARVMRETGFSGRVVCSHACALAAQAPAISLSTLDDVARVPITLVSLPMANLLLQDAVAGRTPRERGITLIKEAAARSIPVLLASDSVQDAFCRFGSLDPIETLAVATLAAQLEEPLDEWSAGICRADRLAHDTPRAACLAGAKADLVLFTDSDTTGWPSRAARRVILREGLLSAGAVPPQWCAGTPSGINPAATGRSGATNR